MPETAARACPRSRTRRRRWRRPRGRAGRAAYRAARAAGWDSKGALCKAANARRRTLYALWPAYRKADIARASAHLASHPEANAVSSRDSYARRKHPTYDLPASEAARYWQERLAAE